MGLAVGKAQSLVQKYIKEANKLKESIRENLCGLMGEHHALSDEDHSRALQDLYWEQPEIPEEWLHECFCLAISEDDYQKSTRNRLIAVECNQCQCDISMIARDRKDMKRLSGMFFVCPDCVRNIKRKGREEDLKEEQIRANERLEKEVVRLRSLPYSEYLMTDHWKGIREVRLKLDNHRCQLCRSKDRLNVHHSTYERLGCESPDDLITLCSDCHRNFHDHRQLARPQ